MDRGYGWLMRPVVRGLCGYKDLIDGSLDLEDVAVMNEALDIENENEYRFNRAQERKNK